jgi:hypothetical protein
MSGRTVLAGDGRERQNRRDSWVATSRLGGAARSAEQPRHVALPEQVHVEQEREHRHASGAKLRRLALENHPREHERIPVTRRAAGQREPLEQIRPQREPAHIRKARGARIEPRPHAGGQRKVCQCIERGTEDPVHQHVAVERREPHVESIGARQVFPEVFGHQQPPAKRAAVRFDAAIALRQSLVEQPIDLLHEAERD